MRWRAILAVAAIAGLGVPFAQAQTASSGPADQPPAASRPSPQTPDPVRRALAQQVIDLNGGSEGAKAQVRLLDGSAAAAMTRLLPWDQRALAIAVQTRMGQALAGLAPPMMDETADSYTEVYTEKELRDINAFRLSDTGRVMQRKQAERTQRTVDRLTPLVFKSLPEMVRAVVEKTCADQHCTAQQRQIIADALEKALPNKAS